MLPAGLSGSIDLSVPGQVLLQVGAGPDPSIIPVPVTDRWALILMALMLLLMASVGMPAKPRR